MTGLQQDFKISEKKKNEKGGYWMINVETSHADVVVEEKNIVRTKQQMCICKLAGLKIEYSPLAPLRTLVNVSCQLQVGILKRENRKS